MTRRPGLGSATQMMRDKLKDYLEVAGVLSIIASPVNRLAALNAVCVGSTPDVHA